MKNKNPLKRLFVDTLGEPFYLNVAQFKNKEAWYPLWYAKWAGSKSFKEAVELRKEAQEWLYENGSDGWTNKCFRTVKITLYK